MATGSITHLPHIQNTQSGREKSDPMHGAIFEVYFTLPEAIASSFTEDSATLTEQVVSVTGLDALQKTVQAGSQKFFGVDVSFLNPTVENTYAELTITFNLNIRNATDAWVLKIIKAWEKLGYDLADGSRTLMRDYCADNLRIAEANRDGTVWRSYIFHKVMLTNVTNIDELNYTNNEARTLQVQFRADYWDEDLA
jgi:hypothetical protein